MIWELAHWTQQAASLLVYALLWALYLGLMIPKRPVGKEGGRQPSWGTGWEVLQAASTLGLTELSCAVRWPGSNRGSLLVSQRSV